MSTNSGESFCAGVLLFYPSFADDCRVILPGETVRIDCLPSKEDQIALSTSADSSILLLQPLPKDSSMLILHPEAFLVGEQTAVRITNASPHVFIIAKSEFDVASRLGRGIFRGAEVIPYAHPIARGFRLPLLFQDGGCAS